MPHVNDLCAVGRPGGAAVAQRVVGQSGNSVGVGVEGIDLTGRMISSAYECKFCPICRPSGIAIGSRMVCDVCNRGSLKRRGGVQRVNYENIRITVARASKGDTALWMSRDRGTPGWAVVIRSVIRNS